MKVSVFLGQLYQKMTRYTSTTVPTLYALGLDKRSDSEFKMLIFFCSYLHTLCSPFKSG